MKRKNIAHDRQRKQELWVERTVRITGIDTGAIRVLLSQPRRQSLRLNPLRLTPDKANKLRHHNVLGQPVSWCQNGFEIDPPTIASAASSYSNDAVVYIQNAASWLPVLALAPEPGDTIFDVCAAPGGKASHIQAMTNNRSKLTCNDNSKPRLIKLQANMQRLGAVAAYTLCDATKLSRRFQPNIFDKILLDAPCSGEGLMTLDTIKLFDSWSVAHIRRLSDLQKKILQESWRLLRTGGTLVYSTCTMAPEENEGVIDYFLRRNPDAQLDPVDFPLENKLPALSSWNNKPYTNDLSPCLRLLPGQLTEAFFVAKLVKSGTNH